MSLACEGGPGRDQKLIRALCSWPLERRQTKHYAEDGRLSERWTGPYRLAVLSAQLAGSAGPDRGKLLRIAKRLIGIEFTSRGSAISTVLMNWQPGWRVTGKG